MRTTKSHSLEAFLNRQRKRFSGKNFYSTLTARLRVLPDFLCIGTMKGGTSSLHEYLNQHPHMRLSATKEVHFFDYNYEKGVNWYRAHFPTHSARARLKRNTGAYLVTGESSPSYLAAPEVPARVHDLLPEVKLIIVLRHPVDRAYSHYYYRKNAGRESESFETVVEKDLQFLGEGWTPLIGDENGKDGRTPRELRRMRLSYLSRGFYAEQLEMWMKVFPRERFLILNAKALSAEPSTTLRRTHEFLGAEPYDLEEYPRYNRGSYNTKMSPALRTKLVDFFAPHNQRLYDLVGEDFGWDQ